MLFDSTLRKDLARTFGATLVVILTIVLTMMLIRTLGLAAGGKVSPQDVVLLLGYTALGHLPTILNLSLFIAVVATLGRMYRDSEMAIWFASGAGLSRFVRPVLRMSGPVLAVVVVLVLLRLALGQPQQRRPARPLREAQRPLKGRAGPVPDLERRQQGVLHRPRPGRRRDRPQCLHPLGQRAGRIGDLGQERPARAAGRRALPRARARPAQRRQQRQRREDLVALRDLPHRRRRPRGKRDRQPAAEGAADARAAAQPEPEVPGRARLAPRPGARRRQPAAARARSGGDQSAPRQQLEPALRAARLRRLLQPDQPVAVVGRQRPLRHGAGAARAARQRLRARADPASGGARTAPCAARAGGRRRRPRHEDGAAAALPRHRRLGRCSPHSPSCRCSSSSTSSTSSTTSASRATSPGMRP